MSDFMRMAESVRKQAEAFLDAEGVPMRQPLPDVDENRTIGDMVAAPLPEDRVTAALLALRTAQTLLDLDLDVFKMSCITNPEDAANRITALGYRLCMYQYAMQSDVLREKFRGHHRRKPRRKGTSRAGTAAWLIDHLTSSGKSLDQMLGLIAEKGSAITVLDLPMELHKPRGGLAEDGHFSNDYRVHFHLGNEWRKVKVKRLREVAKNNAKLRNPD